LFHLLSSIGMVPGQPWGDITLYWDLIFITPGQPVCCFELIAFSYPLNA
jgi:hypothetical protein